MQEFEYIDNRKSFRGAGILLLALLFLAIYVMFSAARGAPTVGGGPDTLLPKVGALPPGSP